jgi:hypothetical protein
MNLDKIVKRSREIARPFRVTGKDKFRLKDFDPDDTGDLGNEDKPRGIAGRCCWCSRPWMRPARTAPSSTSCPA